MLRIKKLPLQIILERHARSGDLKKRSGKNLLKANPGKTCKKKTRFDHLQITAFFLKFLIMTL